MILRGRPVAGPVPHAAPDERIVDAPVSPPFGRPPREVPEQVTGTVLILVVALAFQLAGVSGPAGVALTAIVAAAVAISWAWLRFMPHPVRTGAGLALVKTRRAADGSRIRVLSLGGVWQSATYLDGRRFDPVFAYQRAFDAAFDAEGEMRERFGHGLRRVLAIGGGGFAWPKHAVARHPEVEVEVAEIDPAVIGAARRWFFLDEAEELAEGRLRVRCADGLAVLGETGEPYDAIVSDAFSGAEPVRALAALDAVRSAHARLAPGGVYLANVVSRDGGRDLGFLRDSVATLTEVFAYVKVVPVSDEEYGGEDNYLVAASDADYPLAGAVPFDEGFLGDVIR